jgi:predicted tellurium resistance membrane protein TerC
LKWVERYPSIVYVGAGVLAWTAVKMMTSEPLVKPVLEQHGWIAPLAYAVVVGGVLGGGWLAQRRRKLASAAASTSVAPRH